MKRKRGIYESYIKRVLDFGMALISIIIFSPVLIGIGILTRVKLGKPVFFTQERLGKDNKVFKVYKFRTMNFERDENGDLLPDELRSTELGRAIRGYSLDELPQLWNILKGDMSIIGPRPLLVEYLPYYTEVESHRHDVRPGLTGLAQINGRNFIKWDQKLQKDVEYVSDISFWGDFKILVKTVGKVLTREGVAIRMGEVEQPLSAIRRRESDE